MSNQPTVSDIFRRAQEIRTSSGSATFDDIRSQIVSEFSGKPFPSAAYLTIPELDNIAPEEDWTAGLPIVLRGIQTEDWKEIAHGIIICLEQVENYPKESGREDDPEKEWRNRDRGIASANKKNFDKWLPEDLLNIAKKGAESS
ncbi:MAG: hypothetical protein R2681_12905 [Pyrinomonadaceae bacterium]